MSRWLKWAGTLRKRRAGSAAIDALYLCRRTIRRLILVHLRLCADCSHGFSLFRPADDLLHHALGSRGGRGAVFSAQRTQPGVGGPGAVNWLQFTVAIIPRFLSFYTQTFPFRCPFLIIIQSQCSLRKISA